MKLMPSFINIE